MGCTTQQGIRLIRTIAIGAIAGALLAVPALAAAAGAAFDLDLRTPGGTRVAAIAGSVNARGVGYAQIVPLSGAPTVGMARDETAMATREADGAILIRGGLGTRIRIHLDRAASTSTATGRLALDVHASRAIDVVGTGISADRPYVPEPGHVVIAIGYPKGPIRVALARRYRVVRYAASTWSRTALLAHPQRIARVAGMLIGPSVTEARLRHIDGVRALYNAGRWTAVSDSPAAFDRHMYVVAHAHVGRGGVILRHPGGQLGESSRTFLQIRQPRVARIRVGRASRGRDTLPHSAIVAAVGRGTDHLVQAIAERENASGMPTASTRQAGDAVKPPTINPEMPNLAYYSVPLDQNFQVLLSTETAPSAYNVTWSCSTVGSGLWFSGTCPPTTLTQQTSINFDPVYTVSLNTGGGTAVGGQTVSETSQSTFNASESEAGVVAQGTYNQSSDTLAPAQWGTPTENLETAGQGCKWGCLEQQQVGGNPSETGLLLAMGYHSIVAQCVACAGTGGSGSTVDLLANEQTSSPNQQIQNLVANASTGTDWSTSTSATSGWQVSGNLGFFGGDPMGGIGGGYNSSTTKTQSKGGDLQSSVGFTESNWTTNGIYGKTNASTTANPIYQAAYITSSKNIASAGGDAASAASSYAYPTQLSTGSSYVPTPSQYGNPAPAPSCTGSVNQPLCLNGSSVAGWGSAENIFGYTQGSVAAFNLQINSDDALAVGSVAPWVTDSYYLVDQWQWPNWSYAASGPFLGPSMIAFTQLQVLGQTDITAASMSNLGTPGITSTTHGWGIAEGVTTYYNGQGQVISGAANGANGEPVGAAYSTVGLDLCAPPVLTTDLWTAGCDQDPSLNGGGSGGAVPATAQGAGPMILANGQPPRNSNGTNNATLGASLSCSSGTWSGSPTFSYAWQRYNQVWVPVQGATGRTFKPTTAGYYACVVTATNAAAPKGIQAMSQSIRMVPSGS